MKDNNNDFILIYASFSWELWEFSGNEGIVPHPDELWEIPPDDPVGYPSRDHLIP